mmetsp:Transcript_1238/g.4096  ORF Transcript_1238/g.4096 Transcript_1238/m.4096 type:complete len:80 (+) Transcript_1238:2448-2687(+)
MSQDRHFNFGLTNEGAPIFRRQSDAHRTTVKRRFPSATRRGSSNSRIRLDSYDAILKIRNRLRVLSLFVYAMLDPQISA